MKIKSNFSITIIGAGNVATQLSLNLHKKGFKIDCIYNYNIKSAKRLASKLNCYFTNNKKEIPNSSDLYIVALKDDNILNTLNGVDLKDKLIAHTSGSFDSKLLNTHSSNWACFYIMQTILSNFDTDFTSCQVLIEANNSNSLNILKEIAIELGSDVKELNSIQREKLHIAAIATNNFTYHLFSCIQKYCIENDISFDILKPLLEETINNINKQEVFKLQTGPAKRGDMKTIYKHLDLLKNKDESMFDIYTFFNKQIIQHHSNDNST